MNRALIAASCTLLAMCLAMPSHAHAAAAPKELKFACSSTSLRYVAGIGACKPAKSRVDFTKETITACARAVGGDLRKVAAAKLCAKVGPKHERVVTLPSTTTALRLCARPKTAVLRLIGGSATCAKGEVSLKLAQRKPAPPVVGTHVNAAPIAQADVATATSDTGVAINVLANDRDPEGSALSVALLDTTGTRGSVTLSGGVVTWTPGTSFASLGVNETAQDSFTYTASDGASSSTPVTVSITVLKGAHLAISGNAEFASDPGDTTALSVVTITNDGHAVSGPIATTLSGADNSLFEKTADTCDGTALAPAQTCTLQLTFSATSVTTFSALLSATALPGSTVELPLVGQGQITKQGATLSISHALTFAFPTTSAGSSATPQAITVQNIGEIRTSVIAITLTDNASSAFLITDDTCTGVRLNPHTSCSFSVTYAPAIAGSSTATLRIAATFGGTVSGVVSGSTSAPANLHLSTDYLSYGKIAQGSTSRRTLTISNTGTEPAGTIYTELYSSGADQFNLQNDTCTGEALAGGASCTVDVVFAPTATGSMTPALQVFANPGGNTHTVSLNGTGAATPASLEVSLTSDSIFSPGVYSTSTTLDIGTVPVGTDKFFKLWVHNAGAADAYIRNWPAPVTGANMSFNNTVLVDGGFSSCGVPSATVIRGSEECYYRIRYAHFLSTGPGSLTTSIVASPGGTVTATIQGIGS